MRSPFLTPREKVMVWFHTPYDDEIAPCESIQEFNDIFLEFLDSLGLVVFDESDFRRAMCNAVCTLRLSFDQSKNIDLHMTTFPNRKYRNIDWKNEFNELWDLYLQNLFNSDTLQNLFEKLDVAIWEDALSNWRHIVGSLLQYYIKPSVDILEKEGFLTVDEDDEYITYEEAHEDESLTYD